MKTIQKDACLYIAYLNIKMTDDYPGEPDREDCSTDSQYSAWVQTTQSAQGGQASHLALGTRLRIGWLVIMMAIWLVLMRM